MTSVPCRVLGSSIVLVAGAARKALAAGLHLAAAAVRTVCLLVDIDLATGKRISHHSMHARAMACPHGSNIEQYIICIMQHTGTLPRQVFQKCCLRLRQLHNSRRSLMCKQPQQRMRRGGVGDLRYCRMRGVRRQCCRTHRCWRRVRAWSPCA
jgi:hypothetical protein